MKSSNYLIEGMDYLSVYEKLEELIGKNSFEDATRNKYDLSEVLLEKAIEDLNTYGMFSSKKVIIISNFDKMNIEENENDINNLFKYLDNATSDNLLFILAGKFDERKKITKDLKKYCEFIKVDIDPNSFIKENLAGYKLESGVINLLIENTLGDITRLYNECEKLKNYKINDKYITKNDVLELAVKKKGDSTEITFQFSRALAEKNKKQALLLYKELLDYLVEPLSIIGLLGSQFRIMYQVKVLEEKGLRNDNIASTLKEKPYRVMKTRELTRYYSKREILDLIIKIGDIDFKIKTMSVDANSLIELFILNI